VHRPTPFQCLVTDLLGRPGASRDEQIDGPLSMTMEQGRIVDPVRVAVHLSAMPDEELLAEGEVTFEARLSCFRCLREDTVASAGKFLQLFTDEPDEDGLVIGRDGTVDLELLVRDAIAEAVPLVYVCAPGCKGLCPTCGTDLNVAPCSGHPEESDSPFGALRELLDSQD
jgi:uncharacterized protein